MLFCGEPLGCPSWPQGLLRSRGLLGPSRPDLGEHLIGHRAEVRFGRGQELVDGPLLGGADVGWRGRLVLDTNAGRVRSLLTEGGVPRELIERYADLSLAMVDASVITVAERLGEVGSDSACSTAWSRSSRAAEARRRAARQACDAAHARQLTPLPLGQRLGRSRRALRPAAGR